MRVAKLKTHRSGGLGCNNETFYLPLHTTICVQLMIVYIFLIFDISSGQGSKNAGLSPASHGFNWSIQK